jgi:Putative ATP-dependent DNA helicase recG C-terminal
MVALEERPATGKRRDTSVLQPLTERWLARSAFPDFDGSNTRGRGQAEVHRLTPPAWTVERLRGKHPSVPFNPGVASAFFRAGPIESWGRGIERTVQMCRAADAPDPVLRHEGTGLWVEFARPGG